MQTRIILICAIAGGIFFGSLIGALLGRIRYGPRTLTADPAPRDMTA